jgi:predicted neuraminidase
MGRINTSRASRYLALLSALGLLACAPAAVGPALDGAKPFHRTMEIFEPIDLHVHGASVVELPNGDLLAAWFEGSGERWADDVLIKGARLRMGASGWSEPFVLADTAGFPDINPVLFIDGRDRLWLLWYTVLANLWETSLPKYRISTNYTMAEGPPEWDWQEVLHVKPGDSTERGIQPGDRFVRSVGEQAAAYREYLEESGFFADEGEESGDRLARWESRATDVMARASGTDLMREGHLYHEDGTHTVRPMGFPLMRRIGWQTYNKPAILDGGRMIVPLYSDGFSFSLMAITDDWGDTWTFSEPLVGLGNIQAAIAQRADGGLVAYMRDNGPPPKRLHVSESRDRGETWSRVEDSDLPNPGSGCDLVTTRNGHWLLVYNDSERGRHSLAAAISDDEGKTWKWKRRLELDSREDGAARSHYPAVIQGSDGTFHLVYSHHFEDRPERRRTVKYARFNEAWIRSAREGDSDMP